jgi:hypothetical protein
LREKEATAPTNPPRRQAIPRLRLLGFFSAAAVAWCWWWRRLIVSATSVLVNFCSLILGIRGFISLAVVPPALRRERGGNTGHWEEAAAGLAWIG